MDGSKCNKYVAFQVFFEEFVSTIWAGDTFIYFLSHEELRTFDLLLPTALTSRRDVPFFIRLVPNFLNQRENYLQQSQSPSRYSFFESTKPTRIRGVHFFNFYGRTYRAEASYRYEVDALVNVTVGTVVIWMDRWNHVLGKDCEMNIFSD